MSQKLNAVEFYLAEGYRVTQEYGWRIHPIYGDRRFHHGTDFGGKKTGFPLRTPFPGEVAGTNYSNSYGYWVTIRSNVNPVLFFFGHMNKVTIKRGDKLKVGDVIGEIGSTGLSTGPHLHFEVRLDNGTQLGRPSWGDPRDYFEEVPSMKEISAENVIIFDEANPDRTFKGVGIKEGTTSTTYVEFRAFLQYLGGTIGTNNYPHRVGFNKPAQPVPPPPDDSKLEQLVKLFIATGDAIKAEVEK